MTKPSRRELLRTLGAGGALLPFVPLTAREAEAAPPPRRLLVWFTANGLYRKQWEPVGGETDFQLGEILRPLEPYKRDLTIVRGLDWKSWLIQSPQPPNEHQNPLGHTLTGSFTALPRDYFAQGPSVDQVIAQRIGVGTKFESLFAGIKTYGGNISTRIVWKSANTPLPPVDDPQRIFDRIFADLRAPTAAGPAGADPRTLDRKSVIDLVKSDLGLLRPRLGAEDQRKMDAHLEAVRAYERRIGQAIIAPTAACARPNLAAEMQTHPVWRTGRQHMANLLMAFSCDLTRVATIMWAPANSNESYPFLGFSDGHHALAHYGGGGTQAEQNGKLTRIATFHAQQLAYLIGEMKKIPEGTGTMFDNTLILWCSEHARGESQAHDRRNLPFLLAGGLVRGGRNLAFPGRGHNDLFVSLCHAFGLTDIGTFGARAACAGPLPGLV